AQFDDARPVGRDIAGLEETIAAVIERAVEVDYRLGTLPDLGVHNPHSGNPVQRVDLLKRAVLVNQLLLKVQALDGEGKFEFARAYRLFHRRVVNAELILDHSVGGFTWHGAHTPGVAAAGQEVAEEDRQQPYVDGVGAEPVPYAALGVN